MADECASLFSAATSFGEQRECVGGVTLDGVEPSFPGCQPGVFAVGPQGHCLSLPANRDLSRQSSRQELNLPRPAYQTGASPLGHGWKSGRDRTRTCKKLSPRPPSKRVESPISAPFLTSCPGRTRTCNRPVNSRPHNHCATGHSGRTLSKMPPGVEPDSLALQASASPSGPGIVLQSQRWESNPHPALYESAAQPFELRRPQYPRQESNLISDLRTVVCLRHTPRTSKLQGLDLNQQPTGSEPVVPPIELPWKPSVAEAGLEPARLKTPDSESGASAIPPLGPTLDQYPRRDLNPRSPA